MRAVAPHVMKIINTTNVTVQLCGGARMVHAVDCSIFLLPWLKAMGIEPATELGLFLQQPIHI